MSSLISSTLAIIPFADWHHDGGGGWWFLFPLFWIVVIVAIVFIARRGRWCGPINRVHHESAVELLERRFAEGQIDGDEYTQRRSVLDPPN